MLLLNKIKLRQAGRALGLGEAHKERALEASLVSPWYPYCLSLGDQTPH